MPVGTSSDTNADTYVYAFSGHADITPENASSLLSDEFKGKKVTKVISHRRIRHDGLNNVLDFLEEEDRFGEHGVTAEDDIVPALLEAMSEGAHVTLVMLWSEDDSADYEKDLALVRDAAENDIPVVSLTDGLAKLTLDEGAPEQEPEQEQSAPEQTGTPGTPPVQSDLDFAVSLREHIRRIVREEIALATGAPPDGVALAGTIPLVRGATGDDPDWPGLPASPGQATPAGYKAMYRSHKTRTYRDVKGAANSANQEEKVFVLPEEVAHLAATGKYARKSSR